ncbi:hypothetical protein [Halalkalibacter krulwichiae]|uniref:DUF4352 domain-containing protein n=1 Tax=Halalkalibacter krulwichiae TaxID=199441 RepID=A0A1X9MDS8_9BACI|nr:hypothetical protein [Halalkalibacter krulwichiae]ARK28592.1 hypothetical protein BkAM31D_01205 [Halalkalibacter krulwichiae]
MKKRVTRKTSKALVTFMGAIAFMTACSSATDSGQTNENEPEVVEATSENLTIEDEQEAEQDEGKEEIQAEPDQGKEANKTELPEKLQVDQQLIHDNGTVATIESIEFGEEVITVNVNVKNGRLGDIFFAHTGRKGLVLEDDTGVQYPFLPPNDNEGLMIGTGEQLSGALVFLGRVNGEAKELSLTVNPHRKDDNERTSTPYFFFESIEIQR